VVEKTGYPREMLDLDLDMEADLGVDTVKQAEIFAAIRELYGIPRDRVIGTASTFEYTSNDHGGTITHKAETDFLDDGPQKPIRIWSRTGRRPILAAGNSNGDIPMLEFTYHPDKPYLRLLLLHDDDEREFAYTTGAERSLEQADKLGWTIVSMRNDWATVF